MSAKIKLKCLCLLSVIIMVGASPGWGHDGAVVLECDEVGTGGAGASTRGIQFTVKGSFASIEVPLAGQEAGYYPFNVELRRSSGYMTNPLASVRVETNLSKTTYGYTPIHIDFPPVKVTGTETFTLKFVDIGSNYSMYIASTTFGQMPCPDALITDENNVYDPTPIASAAGLRVLASPSGCDDCPGDINGDYVVDLNDFKILTGNWLNVCIPEQMPLLEVSATSLPSAVIQGLALQFNIPLKLIQNDNGVLRYTNLDKFQVVPTIDRGIGQPDEEGMETTLESFDFESLTGRVLSEKTALGLVSNALQKAGVPFSAGLEVIPTVDHTMFEAVGADGKLIKQVPLDTQVNYQFKFGAIPITGPGAKMKFIFDAQGELVHMTLGLPAVQTGGSYDIMPQAQADAMALEVYGFVQPADPVAGEPAMNLPGTPNLTSKLVYWAPADATNLVSLLPHYLYGGTVPNPQGGPDIILRNILLPAYQAQTSAVVPKVQLFVDNFRNTIHAGTETWGGTPPYTYAWTSSTTDITYKTGSSIDYKVNPRAGMPDPTVETVTVVVTDAAGVKVSASRTVGLLAMDPPVLADEPILPVGGVLDVGTEWVGLSQGLGGSSSNATGFVATLGNAGAHVRYNWGDENAWERDFKDPVYTGGDDTNWIDNVDAAFYTGHADGTGFTFSSNVNDGFLHYTEARWGNYDLEWLVIAACGPLQLESGGKQWYQRWGPAFYRLHILCGYQTGSSDNTVEGTKYANYLLSGHTVRQAWIKTAIEVQPSDVRYGVMGVIGPGGLCNFNDHYWGKGSVGADVWPGDKIGYWLVHGPC